MTDTRPLALITGASSGIGYELARQFTTHGDDAIVAAEDDGIITAAAALAVDGASVEGVQVDLREPDGVEQLYKAVGESVRPLAAAALNAGVGRGSKFVETELQDDFDIVDLNVRSTMHLAKLVLPDMAARNSGKVLFTSSIASTMPGPTDTKFFHRAKMDDTVVGRMPNKDDPAEVARQGFDALMRGDQKVVAESLSTKVIGLANRVLPDSVKAVANRVLSAPVSR